MRRLMWLCAVAAVVTAPLQAGEKKGTAVTLDGLKSTTPADWKKEEVGNKFRVYQFSTPKAEGDAKAGEVVIFFFDGSGGSADDNIKRWKGMFRPPEGKSIDEVAKITHPKNASEKAKLTYLDVHGTYVFKFPPFDPNAKEQKLPNYRMLGVYFDSPNGPYFIRLTGPAKTVEAQKKGFDEWITNFK